MNRRWLAIWLADWPIQRLRSAMQNIPLGATPSEPVELGESGESGDRRSGLLLWREDSRRGRVVVAACQACQSLGIKPHQPLYEATDLIARASLPVLVYRHDPLADAAAIASVASLLQQHISPLVAMEPAATFCGLLSSQPQTLLLDVTGIGDWFGDEQALLTAAVKVLGEQGLQARMAITDTSAAAWAMVRWGTMARQLPGGSQTLLIPPGEMMSVVANLPTRALRLDGETAHQLDRLGLRRIADVMELPREGLAARLGSDLLRRIDELTGSVAQTLTMHHAVAEESAVCELEYPTSDREILEHRLRGLVDQISSNLASRRRGALRLVCQLEMVQHPMETIEIGLFAPTSDATHLSRLVIGAMERRHLPGMVQKVTLMVALGGPLQQYQPTMFGDDSISQVAMRRSLAQMIETLAGRLGRDCVVGIQTSRNPLPESAFKLKPLAGESRSTLSLGKGSESRSSKLKSPRQTILPPALGPLASDPLRRPLRLFNAPEPIEVLELGPEAVPRRIRVANRVYHVLRHWGPERIETGWWDGPQIRRDYYRIELEGGAWWWIFRQLSSSSPAIWKLHGQFT